MVLRGLRKQINMCLPLHLEYVESTHNLGKETKAVVTPNTGFRLSWNFATIYNHFRDPLTQTLKKDEDK